jgi:hypothetical protein
MPPRSTRRLYSSIARRTRRPPHSQTIRLPRSARSPSGISAIRMLISRRWSEIRCKAIWIFSPSILAIRWRRGCGPLWRLAARRLPGGAPARSTRRRPTGRTCAAIRAVRMSLTPTVDWRISPPLLSRRRRSLRSLTRWHRRWKMRWCISVAPCWSSMIRIMDSSRRRRRRYFSWPRRRRILWSWHRRHRYSGSSSCRSRHLFRSPATTIRRPISRRRRRISSTTTFTTRSSSTTRPTRSPSPTPAARRRRSRPRRRLRLTPVLRLLLRWLLRQRQHLAPHLVRHLAPRPHAHPGCRQALRRWWEQRQVPLCWRRHCRPRRRKKRSRFRINLRQRRAPSRLRRHNLRPNSQVSRRNRHGPVNLHVQGNLSRRGRARRPDSRCLDNAGNRFRLCQVARPRQLSPASRRGQVSRRRVPHQVRHQVPHQVPHRPRRSPDSRHAQDNRGQVSRRHRHPDSLRQIRHPARRQVRRQARRQVRRPHRRGRDRRLRRHQRRLPELLLRRQLRRHLQ